MDEETKKKFVHNLSTLCVYTVIVFSILTLCTSLSLRNDIGISVILGLILGMFNNIITNTGQLSTLLNQDKTVSKQEILEAIESLRKLFENPKLSKETTDLIETKIVELLKEI